MVKKILGQHEKVLREVAKVVPIEDITSPKIKKIIKEMSEALRGQDDGVAIAAPQIGYSLRIFLVSGRIFEEDFHKSPEDTIVTEEKKEVPKDLVFINPEISKLSRGKEWLPEGCLSVRWLYGKTFRSKKATIIAYDENGKKFKRGGADLLAQIFQHETDHLNGILFIDHAIDVREELPANKK